MNCSACKGELEDGFLPDLTHNHVGTAVWIAGAPSLQKSTWQRLRLGQGVNIQDVDARAIEAKRCVDCGRLELFANRRPDADETLVR